MNYDITHCPLCKEKINNKNYAINSIICDCACIRAYPKNIAFNVILRNEKRDFKWNEKLNKISVMNIVSFYTDPVITLKSHITPKNISEAIVALFKFANDFEKTSLFL